MTAISSPAARAAERSDVRLVARVEEAGRLVAERELRPHVAHGGALVELELERAGARLLAKRGEESHVHVHTLSVAAGCLAARDMLGPARCPT